MYTSSFRSSASSVAASIVFRMVSRRASTSERSSRCVLWWFERTSTIAIRGGVRLAYRRSRLNRGYNLSTSLDSSVGTFLASTYRIWEDVVSRMGWDHVRPIFHDSAVAQASITCVAPRQGGPLNMVSHAYCVETQLWRVDWR
jgi:hypothetical protein